MNGLETLIAQAYGRDDDTGVLMHLLGQSVWFILLGTPIVMGSRRIGLPAPAATPGYGTPANIVAETATLPPRPLIWSTLPLMAYMALRRFLQSVDNVFWISFSLITAALRQLAGRLRLPLRPSSARTPWAWRAPHGERSWCASTCCSLLVIGTCLPCGVCACVHRLAACCAPAGKRLRVLLRIGWPSGLEAAY